MASRNSILQNIERYVELSEEDRTAFQQILRVRKVAKKDFIAQPGEICAYQSYVQQGVLRAYCLDPQGDEHTIQFAIEDWFISDFYSYVTQSPGTLYVQAIEDAEVHQIEYHDVERLCRERASFERFFRMVGQKAFAYSQRRIFSNLSKSAEERYAEFSEQYPEIVQRVPLYMLASYLGMTPVTISKVRRALAQ